MNIKTIRIDSFQLCFGLPPKENDEILQHLTITHTGMIWFKSYTYHPTLEYPLARKHTFSIGKKKATAILSLIEEYFEFPIYPYVTDVGDWKITITQTNNTTHTFEGPLLGELETSNINLSQFIQDAIPIDNLFVFGEPYEEEMDD